MIFQKTLCAWDEASSLKFSHPLWTYLLADYGVIPLLRSFSAFLSNHRRPVGEVCFLPKHQQSSVEPFRHLDHGHALQTTLYSSNYVINWNSLWCDGKNYSLLHNCFRISAELLVCHNYTMEQINIDDICGWLLDAPCVSRSSWLREHVSKPRLTAWKKNIAHLWQPWLGKIVCSAMKIARYKEHLTFSHRYHQYRLSPPFLTVRPLVRNSIGMKITERFARQFLSALIGRGHVVINKMRRSMTSLIEPLPKTLSTDEYLMAMHMLLEARAL